MLALLTQVSCTSQSDPQLPSRGAEPHDNERSLSGLKKRAELGDRFIESDIIWLSTQLFSSDFYSQHQSTEIIAKAVKSGALSPKKGRSLLYRAIEGNSGDSMWRLILSLNYMECWGFRADQLSSQSQEISQLRDHSNKESSKFLTAVERELILNALESKESNDSLSCFLILMSKDSLPESDQDFVQQFLAKAKKQGGQIEREFWRESEGLIRHLLIKQINAQPNGGKV
ncbi:hypothetical protein CCB80_00780 [Armatimonadetes bacterium Uphvl-Ar1]|nr:hypothetical protein CCB80_00780 [Armatimonadetes bacterium Uphvl-Ar1]